MHKTLYKTLLIAVSFVSLISSPAIVKAEQIGEISLSDFLVEPSFYFTEKGTVSGTTESGFSLGHTYFSAKWNLQKKILGRIMLGQYSLLNRPSWSPVTESGLGFVEAYAEYKSQLGTIRAGLLPVAFGLDGATQETRLWFPRHFLYTQGLMQLRDMGFSYQIAHNDFYTQATLHNGEGGADQDRRLFYTGRIGWDGPAGMTAGLSGSVGYYKTSTTQDTKTRIGNVFFGMNLYAVGLGLEATMGELKSQISKKQFLNWYVSARHNLGKRWGFLMKYEFFDPSQLVKEDSRKQGLLGVFAENETGTSRVTLAFLKNWEEKSQNANDEYRLTWRITSDYID